MGDITGGAPGAPGIPPRWTTSRKSGIGTSLTRVSRVWFTLSHGIFNEIYYPRVDQACTRDMGLIVTDGRDFFSEEKRHTKSRIEHMSPGVPAYRLVNTCNRDRYSIEKEVLSDPRRDCVLQNTRFIPLMGGMDDYHLYVLLAPHLGNRGHGNTAWVGDYKGVPMLFAVREAYSVALACSAPWLKRSAGFAGFSDGYQDLVRNKVMTREFSKAEDGNVALTAEVDIKASGGEFLLALGFGRNPAEAGNRARASLLDGFASARDEYISGWRHWQDGLLAIGKRGRRDIYRTSTAVLRAHEEKRFPGGIIAGLSIPWGSHKGDDDLGGYHLVWPRDLVESAGGLLAAGAGREAVHVLDYLAVTQETDGHWPQNMWLDGSPYWSGVQMDETALPILLADLALREKALDGGGPARFWPMVRRAACFLVQNGPVTQQDRWEEDPGYSPFTLAVEVAALLAAADIADMVGEHGPAAYLRETADNWNANIERWVYASDNELARSYGVDGYYMRIAPEYPTDCASPAAGFVPIKNRPPDQCAYPGADHIVSPDALALVRFGLRAPDDPRILGTVKVVDGMLKVETPGGPVWRRYNGDRYGEYEDGSPFDGSGIGRPWPLLTGERAHFELAAGRLPEAERLMRAMESFAYDGWLIPEQVWDGRDMPGRELFFGRPSGSVMPLVWAHAEYIKLVRSLADGKVFDMPPQTVRRYIVEKTATAFAAWRFNHKSRVMPAGKTLRIETLAPATAHWSYDGWKTTRDITTKDTSLGVHVADLETGGLPAGSVVVFTFYWPEADKWEGQDYEVVVA